MGGKGGGKQTTNTVAEPWSGVRPYLVEGYEQLNRQYAQGAPAYYPGSTVAPMSPYTAAAIQAQADRALRGSPLTQAAQQQLTRTMAGDYLAAGNPYFQGAVAAATRPVLDSYRRDVLPGIDSSFSGAGRYASGAHREALDRAQSGMATAVGDIAARMAADNYGRERQHQIQGMLYAPQLAQQDYFDINQLGTSGSALDAYNQALIGADVERYNYGQNADWLRTQDFIQSLQAMPSGSTTTTTLPRQNAFSSALSTAASGAGLLNLILPGLFASDARLKENIAPVGVLHNGLPVYRFNYIGEPATQTRIGLMAQDVARVRPDAVASIGGLLAVDYGRATQPATAAGKATGA